MRRPITLISFLLISAAVFAQHNSPTVIYGRIPGADDSKLYRIQVGAYKVNRYAEQAFEKLKGASLNPVYEKYQDFTRVLVKGISASQIPQYIEKIRNTGFTEIFIKIDTESSPLARLPVSNAAIPSRSLIEIANRSVRVGEEKSFADLAAGRNAGTWTSSTPHAASVDSQGNITGVNLGNAFIKINETEYISVAVVPDEDFFVVEESQIARLPPGSKSGGSSTVNITEYGTEPTFRLAYRFNNKGENKGASGRNGGIDILGRGADYEWLWTTFVQGGWFYDLNGVKREMVNGFQRGANGVELTVKPEFIYEKGVPFLQLRHILRNTGAAPVSGQEFGASADVMIHKNDYASLIHTPYGAYMADSQENPSLELMFICESGAGIDPVDTLWLGTYSGGAHLNHIYDDSRSDIHGEDSAIGFSYQNISLEPGEAKEYTIRFTLARNED
ncbi:MAG: SPOR domain-containing protein [Treponema sp.]|jgi:hypothetical protein|nr:SPOR domain-containing protein [Treponema sp.]